MHNSENINVSENTNITVTITVVVDKEWIEYCTLYSDLFMISHCGYWLYGLENDNNLGWLCFVSLEVDGEPSIKEITDREDYSSIVYAWKNGKELPNGFYRLNKDAAIRAYRAGVERNGLCWYETADAPAMDSVIQLALLGEIRYG